MKQAKLYTYSTLILILFSFMACRQMSPVISTKKSIDNVMYQRLLDNYAFNRKLKLKAKKTYNITGDQKELSQIVKYDTDGKITQEKRFHIISEYDTLISYLTYHYNEHWQVVEIIISNNNGLDSTYHRYKYDQKGLLSEIDRNGTKGKTTFRKIKNGYEAISMKNVADEDADTAVWQLEYKSYFNEFGNRLNFVLEDNGAESMRFENTFNKKHQQITKTEFFYGNRTSKTTFKYNSKDLLVQEIIETFPYKEDRNQKISPSSKPEKRIFEYDFY